MSTNHETEQFCPICRVTAPRRVRCSNDSCDFVVTTCPKCDREQAVEAFVTDHEKDCVYGPRCQAIARPATFVAPSRAA